MSLPENVYKIFLDIVGPEYISDREYILAAYRHAGPGSFQKPVSPEAVILPGSTEEVQAIVKACNHHNIKYAAITSLLSLGRTVRPGMVLLCLKRMNRILEINEED